MGLREHAEDAWHMVLRAVHSYFGWAAFALALANVYLGTVWYEELAPRWRDTLTTALGTWYALLGAAFAVLEARKRAPRAYLAALRKLSLGRGGGGAIAPDDAIAAAAAALPEFTWDTFNKRVSVGAAWLVCEGYIVDVRAWAPIHAGGANVLEKAVGTDVTALFRGGAVGAGAGRRRLLLRHAHSVHAAGTVRTSALGHIAGYVFDVAELLSTAPPVTPPQPSRHRLVHTGTSAASSAASAAAVQPLLLPSTGRRYAVPLDPVGDRPRVMDTAASERYYRYVVTEKAALGPRVVKLVLAPLTASARLHFLPGQFYMMQVRSPSWLIVRARCTRILCAFEFGCIL